MCVPRTNARRKVVLSASITDTPELSHSAVRREIACLHIQECTPPGNPLLWPRGQHIRIEATRMYLVADCGLLECKRHCDLGKDVRQILTGNPVLIIEIHTSNADAIRSLVKSEHSFPSFAFSYYSVPSRNH